MAKFARIIELENDEQVLLTLEENEETETLDVLVRTDVLAVAAKMRFGFASDELAQEFFENYSTADALKFRLSVKMAAIEVLQKNI